MSREIFTSSGLNSHFRGHELEFDDYIQQTKSMIQQARVDLTPPNQDLILEANAPFELKPKASNYRCGMLLIHGLSGTPYTLKDMGHYFYENNCLVRAVLLPGHGTRPADLMHLHHQEWIKAVTYGIESMLKHTQQIILVGHSLGAALAILHSQYHPAIKGLILSAPALKPKNKFAFISNWHSSVSWLLPRAKWWEQQQQLSFARYRSLPFNGLHQTRLVMKQAHRYMQQGKINKPMFMIATSDDETILTDTVIDCFKQSTNPANGLLLYSNHYGVDDDSRIQVVNSAYPELNILDFSHPCLPVSPDNPHYGIKGDFKDYSHYSNAPDNTSTTIYLGAATKQNLKRHLIQRLSFNPDFAGMMAKIDRFLAHPSLGLDRYE